MKLSVCMILGPCDEKLLDTFASIDQIADEICLLQTVAHGPTTKMVDDYQFVNEVNYEVDPSLMHDDGFLNSFSVARNQSFAMATGDYILWIDADDVISDPQSFRASIERWAERGATWMRADYDYEFNSDGLCTTRHRRERVIKAGTGQWIAPIHEVLEPTRKGGDCNIPREDGYIIHNNIQDGDNTQRKGRNYTMLKRIVDEGGDQRMQMYYGNALLDNGDYEGALEQYFAYLNKSEWDQEKYLVMMRVQNIYRKLKKFKLAKGWCLKAMEMLPQCNTAFLALAEIECHYKKWERAIHWMTLYNQCENMDEGLIHNPAGEEVQPLLILQKAYHELGDFERTLSCTDQLRKLMPYKKEQWDAVESHCLKQLTDMDLIDSYEKILLHTPEEDHQKIYDAVPESLSDYPKFKKHKKKPRPDSKRVLAIFCGYDPTQAWGPESIKTGIGGSEEAVINVSREFVKLGWTVEVYCNCTNEGNIDGVNWYQTSAANPNDFVDLTILWRHPHHVYHAPNSHITWLWNHDLQDGMKAYYDDETMARIDKVMFLSAFHRSTAPWVPNEKVMITTNGVDPKLMITGENDPYTVIYASSPDRGLDTLLDYWPEITEVHPKARLKVFYGFNKWFDLRYKNDKEMMAWKQLQLDRMENDPTITYHGSVGQDVLAQEIASSGVWAYPTGFGEISCITAMKMQCGGAIPVTSNYAALHETCRFGHQVGEYLIPKFDKNEFIQTMISVVGNKAHQGAIRVPMMTDCCTHFRWDRVAKEWNAHFIECSDNKLKQLQPNER
jgi:glycosyltransferase involved in cell wall biosynthesis